MDAAATLICPNPAGERQKLPEYPSGSWPLDTPGGRFYAEWDDQAPVTREYGVSPRIVTFVRDTADIFALRSDCRRAGSNGWRTCHGPFVELFHNPLVAHRGARPQRGRQGQVVVLRDENDLAAVTPRHHMIDRTRTLESQGSRYARILPDNLAESK